MQEILVLPLCAKGPEGDQILTLTLLRHEGGWVLVDAGAPGSWPDLKQALAQQGIAPEQLTHVLVTHGDYDHVGALYEIKKAHPNITVIASAKEADGIEGKQKPFRLCQAEALQQALPKEQQAAGEAFCRMLKSVAPCPVDVRLEGKAWFPFAGGCEVLPTPGHTPGHLSLYLPKHRTIIAGDAAALEEGALGLAHPQFAYDRHMAVHSLEKLLLQKANTVICYHGGVYDINAAYDQSDS